MVTKRHFHVNYLKIKEYRNYTYKAISDSKYLYRYFRLPKRWVYDFFKGCTILILNTMNVTAKTWFLHPFKKNHKTT